MDNIVIIELIDKNDIPLKPCPIEHPTAITPPIPIKTPPIVWWKKSCEEINPSTLNVFCCSAEKFDPNNVPITKHIPKVTFLLLSVQYINNSAEYAKGPT